MKTKQYIRNRKGQPIGVLVSRADDHNYAVGFSLCAVSRGDRFNKQLGEEVAVKRANTALREGVLEEIPKSITEEVIHFAKDCESYYNNILKRDRVRNLVNDNF